MSKNPKVFLVRAGQSGEDEDRVLEGNIAILGYREVPSLANCNGLQGRPRDRCAEPSLTAKPRAVGNFAGQLWAFAVAMEKW